MKRSTYTLRRLLALVLVLVMVGSLFAGCNKKTDDETVPNETQGTTDATAAPTDEPTEAPTEEPTEAPTEPAETVPPVLMGTVNADNLNVREEPYTASDILKRLAINTRIEILEQKIVDGVNWGRIAEGWINLNYVTIGVEFPDPEIGTGPVVDNPNNVGTGTSSTNDNTTGTVSTGLHIRKEANADSASVGTYKKGDKVTILERKGDWGRTNKGWINLKYVDFTNTVTSGSSSSGSSSSGGITTTVSNGNKIILGYGTVINTTSLAIRSGPGANYSMVSFVRKGDELPYFQTSSNGWVRFQKGWVNADYLDLEYVVDSGTEVTVTATELTVREEADYNSNKLATYEKGDEIVILDVDGTWGLVEYASGQYGWVDLDKVKLPTPVSSDYTTGMATITVGALHIREKASASSDSLGTYEKGEEVEILEVKGNWGRTEDGWINLKYTKMTKIYGTGTGYVTASKLNVREEPDEDSDKIGSLDNGDKVVILDTDGNWGKILYDEDDDAYGWISLSYVHMTSTSTDSSSGSSSTSGTKYKVTVQTPGNGTAKVSSTSCAKGTTVTVTATPASGYQLKSVSAEDANGNAVAVINNKTFTMPAANVTVTVEFEPATAYSITANVTAGSGSISYPTFSTAGQKVTFTVNGNGQALSSLTVTDADGKPVTVTNNSFTMPASNVTITAAFAASSVQYYDVIFGGVTPTGKATITPSVTSAAEGDKVTLTVTPADGYTLESVTVKKGSTNVSVSGTGTTRTFTMPKGDVTVSAVVKANEYTVSKSVTGSGTVTVSSSKCAVGTDVTVTATPADGYSLKEIKVYGPSNVIVPVSGNVFEMPGYNVTVYVTFELTPHAVNIATDGHGTVTADKNPASKGTKVTLDVKPDTGYELDQITVAGEKISGTSFTMPASDVAVSVTFKKSTYSVTAKSASNGTISVLPASAKMGDSIVVTVTPASGYELASVTMLKGSTVVSPDAISGNQYTYTMPAGNVTVSATFTKAASQYRVNYDGGVNLRKEANGEADILLVVPNGTVVTALDGSTAEYIKVSYESQTGYLLASLLTKIS